MVAQVRKADTGVRRLVASEVTEVLGRQSGLAKEAVANTAQIVAAVAAAVIGLPAAQQKRLKGKSADVATMIAAFAREERPRSEEHTSELQSLMRISYAVFCLKKKKNTSKHLAPDINLPYSNTY